MDYYEPPMTENIETYISNFSNLTNKLEDSFTANEPVVLSENLKIDYKSALNMRQLEAITHLNGPLLVIAGSGTGKTLTLVYRVAYMLENNIDPNNILLLTFTRNAANEMLTRAQKIIGDKFNLNKITGGTFHSFANSIIRDNPGVFNINKNFNILDAPDSEDTIELVKKEIDATSIGKEFPSKKLIHKIISLSKSSMVSIDNVIDQEFSSLSEFKIPINKIYSLYEEFKLKNEQLDFDDLLLFLLKKLKDNKEFKDQLQNKYRYILVDEFQDTNLVQNQIINELADKYSNLMVVGDDSQSIYSFRGANVENILLFPDKYPECKLIKLEENYRSNINILTLTNEIVNQFKIGYKKKLYSSIYRDSLPRVVVSNTDKLEAINIIDQIKEIQRQELSNFKFKDIAILFRDSFHSNILQLYLNQAKIKYKLFGGHKFNERKPIKDIIAHLKVLFNPSDRVAWSRVLQLIPGIGDKNSAKIIDSIRSNKFTLNPSLFLNTSYYDDLVLLQETFKDYFFDTYNFYGILERICSYYQTVLKIIDDDYRTREEDIKFLLLIAKSYTDVNTFLADFSLNPPNPNDKENNLALDSENKPEDMLTLSTIHSAKGLEWKYVFVIHLNENYFPNSRAVDSFAKLEEEKRLFYVACTRAKEQLFLTVPMYNHYSKTNRLRSSRFLTRLPKTVYQLEGGLHSK